MEITRIPLENALTEGVRWFVKLRWFAAGVVFLLGAAVSLLVPAVRFYPVMILSLAIFAYNCLIHMNLGTMDPRRTMHLQITLDWVALTVLCHFTMGLESPFIPAFLFHVILASIFVSRRACLWHGFIAMLLISGMVALEYTRVLPIPAFPGIRSYPRQENQIYLMLFLGSFYFLILLTIFLSTTVMRQLRKGEEKQLELQESLSRAYHDQMGEDQAKNRFVRMVSHEIRSPLSAAQSMLRVILDGYAGEISLKSKELLERSEHRLVQLLELVNELLDLIRGAQPLAEEEKQDIPVQPILSKILNELEAQAVKKEIRLQAQIGARNVIFRGDVQDLERIFLNLVGNAIKYTPEYGTVKVTGHLKSDNFLLFEVRDTGIGIPADELSRIFDEFYRASNAKKEKREGTGLGLSIVKKTVEKYGGQVTVTSELGKGTVFSLLLPVITIAPDV